VLAARHALYHLIPLKYELPGLNAEAGLLPLQRTIRVTGTAEVKLHGERT